MAKKSNNYYFEALTDAVSYSCAAAEMLNKIICNFCCEDLEVKIKEMHAIEHAADNKKHEMMSKLVHEFITPIEREDIIQLSQEVDDITDKIEEILQCLYMYNLREIKEEAITFGKLVIKACEMLKKATEEFANFKKSTALKPLIIEINRIEDEGDHLYTKVIRSLYMNMSDTVALISWVKIFDLFESCCDSCEHVANSLERVVLKNS